MILTGFFKDARTSEATFFGIVAENNSERRSLGTLRSALVMTGPKSRSRRRSASSRTKYLIALTEGAQS